MSEKDKTDEGKVKEFRKGLKKYGNRLEMSIWEFYMYKRCEGEMGIEDAIKATRKMFRDYMICGV
jgi:hypothetical protein